MSGRVYTTTRGRGDQPLRLSRLSNSRGSTGFTIHPAAPSKLASIDAKILCICPLFLRLGPSTHSMAIDVGIAAVEDLEIGGTLTERSAARKPAHGTTTEWLDCRPSTQFFLVIYLAGQMASLAKGWLPAQECVPK